MEVRLEVPNPGFLLRPGMFANVTLNIDYGVQTLIQSDAVLNSGDKQVVFLAKPGGTFEPRPIKIGNQFNTESVVLEGLEPGEKIVASGNFLIDSESRLGNAMAAMGAMSPAKK